MSDAGMIAGRNLFYMSPKELNAMRRLRLQQTTQTCSRVQRVNVSTAFAVLEDAPVSRDKTNLFVNKLPVYRQTRLRILKMISKHVQQEFPVKKDSSNVMGAGLRRTRCPRSWAASSLKHFYAGTIDEHLAYQRHPLQLEGRHYRSRNNSYSAVHVSSCN
ncbi:predicted protein [Plenodomus lingam JN3]|uniref:Predicted protein n=1 Tax=Leptosphaeria maculans (strain JN3 / isolate v23.1.3 / race Av1-4-5-6-7-8) TaxID=985895 RepID=E5A0N5_LEPMJ|nr:predicted protein [Plenodomus lingam JN3]CBX97181.1 predicted protein [Plenodomus lingam JN3]